MTSPVSDQLAVKPRANRRHIRVLAIIEANTVTGPAKNLLEFCRLARDCQEGAIIDTSLLTFQRTLDGASAPAGDNEFIQQAMREGTKVYSIWERFTFDRRVISKLRELVDRLAPDIIQTHGIKSHFLVRACGAHRGRAWVAFHHGYTNSTLRYALLAHLNRWSLKAPSQVVAVSEVFSRQLAACGVPKDRIVVLHNAADPDWLQLKAETEHTVPQDGVLKLSPGEKLVLAVGRLSKEKRFTDLVAAMRCLRTMHPEFVVRLALLGEGCRNEGTSKRRFGMRG